jgi:hypothetical protein
VPSPHRLGSTAIVLAPPEYDPHRKLGVFFLGRESVLVLGPDDVVGDSSRFKA